jgi:hypothetical protein
MRVFNAGVEKNKIDVVRNREYAAIRLGVNTLISAGWLVWPAASCPHCEDQ